MTKGHAAAVAVAVLCMTGSAKAHVALESKQALAGSTYKAVLQVGHGCEGSPTESIRVQIPEGVIAVKPMPKPGWELTTKHGEYAQAYDYFGEKLTEGIKEVTWTGGNLPDEWYDEFVRRVRLPDGAPAQWFGSRSSRSVLRVCTAGSRFQPRARTRTCWTSRHPS